MTRRHRIAVSKLNPNLGGGMILPPLPVGIPLITQKR